MSDVIRIPKPGDIIAGQFRLEKEIGRGGFGVVYQAQQIGIERRVAVKMLMPHALTHQGVAERFRREAQLASSLTHPNSIAIYAFGVHSENAETEMGLPFIAMEYLDGETLYDYLRRHGRLGLTQTVTIIKQALGSLAEAHQRNIVHRDLKPENIFLVALGDDEFIIKVLDFGIAKAIDSEGGERLTRTGMVTGTAEYMAPEQAQGFADITPALDVYAMGCIAFQLLTGDVPFDGSSPMNIAIKHIAEPIPPLPEYYQDHFIGHTIRKSMAKDPTQRFQNAAEFLDTLNLGSITLADGSTRSMEPVGPIVPTVVPDSGKIKLKAQTSPSPALPKTITPEFAQSVTDPDPPPAPPKKPRNTKLIAAGVLAAILLLLGTVAVFFFIGQQDTSENTTANLNPPTQTAPKPTAAPSKEPTPKEPNPKDSAAPEDSANTQPPPSGSKEPTPKELTSLTLTSNTPATVWDQDKQLGETPLKIERQGDSASRSLELRAEGFVPQEITLKWDQEHQDNTLHTDLTEAAKTEQHASNSPKRPRTKPTKKKNTTTQTPPKTTQTPKTTTTPKTTKQPTTPKKDPSKTTPKKTGPKLFGTTPKVFN